MSIVELMRPDRTRDLTWLQEALQAAVELEFFTLPPYLTAMWSIKDEQHPAAATIRAVVEEEMTHMALAANLLSAAVEKKIEAGADADFIVGGDANAELGTGDFDNLTGGGRTAVSAADEQGGAFSYIKRPKSLIDHIFLSPNLAERFNSTDFFIVAAERSFPNFVEQVSDHRPVLLRMSLGGSPEPERKLEATGGAVRKAALAELVARLERATARVVVDDRRSDGYGTNRLSASFADKPVRPFSRPCNARATCLSPTTMR
jgi:hypothetical protein